MNDTSSELSKPSHPRAESPGRPVAMSLRLYRKLANVFPQEFKNAYGEELVQVTEDAIDFIWRRDGLLGLIRLLLDIAVRVPAEYAAELRQDIHHGVRMLASSPGFTAVAVISLSLGICIATCAYSEMNGLVLRSIPEVPQPDQLVALQAPTSFPNYKRYRELTDLFSSTAAYVAPVPFGISTAGHTERIWGHLVTPSYFSTFGVHAELGRTFDRDEEQRGRAPTVMVSYRFWQQQLGADEGIIGKTLRVNGQPCTVIGVGPKDFLGASPMLLVADLWMPLSVGERLTPELADNALEQRGRTMFQMVARLDPGITPARAEAELDTVTQQLQQTYGDTGKNEKGRRVLLVPGGKLLPIRKQDLPLFTEFFMVLAGLVLLIACSNVANMMLARATDRRREIAVRLAMGASRFRIIRQLLTESMLVAMGAGVLGFLLSMWLMHLFSQQRMPFPMPVTYDVNVDGRALLFALAATVLTGLLFGIVPALQATRPNLTPALKEGGTALVRRYRRLSPRNLLLLSQMAGSLMLLVMVGLLAIGIQSTMGIQQGFNARDLYLISVDPIRDGYSGEQAANFFPKLLERVKRLPSVTAAALTDSVPVAIDGSPGVKFSTAQTEAANSPAIHWALRYVVGKDYFETTGIPILLGRGFQAGDESNDATAVVVSEKLVAQYWKGQDPLGRRIEIDNVDAGPGFGAWPGSFDFRPGAVGKGRRIFEVVGVARDVANDLVAQKEHPAIYFPLRPADYEQPSLRGVTLMVRAKPGVNVISAVQREISAMDSAITPYNARSMTEQIEQFMYPLRTATWTYGVIGAFGLVLASVGLAGVTAYSVAQRRHEIGIRIALGARRTDVLGLVMKQGLALVAVGTLIGLVGAWAGNRLLAGLYSTVATTSTSDPLLLVGAPLLLATVALVACYVPARKSMEVDPVLALRAE